RTELFFEHAVHAAHLLLFAKLQTVLRDLRACLAVLFRRIWATFRRALVGVAALAFHEQLQVLAAAQLTFCFFITSHLFTLRTEASSVTSLFNSRSAA